MPISSNIAENAREHLAACSGHTVPFLRLYCCSDKTISMSGPKVPFIYFVLDGEYRLHTPAGIMDYIAGQYSISAIDTPECGYVIAFSERADFVAASVSFTASEVVPAIISLDDDLLFEILDGTLSESMKMKHDSQALECLDRLISTLDEPISAAYLARHIRNEMIFHILCGSSGSSFVRSVVNADPNEIYEANSWIKQNFRESFKVEDLACRWNMSVSQFHQKFKRAVGMGPLQCQKRLRLTEARRLMLDEKKSVTEAAFDVGYESSSQFAREYRRVFGKSPVEDVRLSNLLRQE